MPIQLLSPQLANQIAAGEVVERPASVVKELLENSLDAGASKIEIDIEKGGHKRIKIKDNGCGIAKHELQLALSRHATSKITTLDDLEQILSLGFRGEALASISSVTRLTLTSKTAEQNEAWQAYCEGREMAVNVKPAAHPTGTTIDVADLFYNTPARRKFLRTEKTEFQHIEDVVKRIALSHPNVSFVLSHNHKVIKRYMSDKAGKLETRIGAVVGQKFVQNAVHISAEYDGLTINAWLGNELMLRSSNDCQFSFVNGRGMRDKLIMHAIRQAYETVWGVIEQPSFVVYLTVDPKDVDVNVHPAKHEVRFQQSRLVHDFICKSVCDALNEATNTGERPLRSLETGVNHDYIRPLQEQRSEEKSTSFSAYKSQYNDSPSDNVAERSVPLDATGARSKPSTGVFSVGSQRQSKGPSAAYQANFSALMTPMDNSDRDAAASSVGIEHCHLSPRCRIYPLKETIYLLPLEKFATIWLGELFLNAKHSQPLLMPVALQCDDVDEKILEFLNSSHFEINKTAGKYRLQQVPAGTRHLPWIKWFEHLLGVKSNAQHNAIDVVIKDMSLSEHDLDDEVAGAIWYWLDHQSHSKQWEIIEQFGKVRPLELVLNVWEK